MKTGKSGEPLPPSLAERVITLTTVIGPFLAVGGAVILFWNNGVGPSDLLFCILMYSISMLGITLGFHRLFTHRSFECVRPVRLALAVAGSMAAQGPVLFWTACHRRHHRHSDDAGDPHSPHEHGGGWKGALHGWWHAHIGWMLNHKPDNYFKLVPDLLRDRGVVWLSRWYLVWVVLGLLLPAGLGAWMTQNWVGFWTGMLWGGLVRVFLVHQSTWSINSICHMFGTQAFRTGDESRNNLFCAVLTFGEGWHNNHHAFPTSARHGLRWWEIDMVYALIKVMQACRLAWNVRLPEAALMQQKRQVV